MYKVSYPAYTIFAIDKYISVANMRINITAAVLAISIGIEMIHVWIIGWRYLINTTVKRPQSKDAGRHMWPLIFNLIFL